MILLEVKMYVSLTGPKGYEQVVIKESIRIPGTKDKKNCKGS